MASEAAPGDVATMQPADAGRGVAIGLALVGAVLGLIGFSLVIRGVGVAGTFEEVVWPGIGVTVLVCTLLIAGVTLRVRRADHPIGNVFLALGIVAAVSDIDWGYTQLQLGPAGDPATGQVAAWVGAVLTTPTWAYLLAVLVIRFPGGEPVTAAEALALRWAPLASVVGGVLIGFGRGRCWGLRCLPTRCRSRNRSDGSSASRRHSAFSSRSRRPSSRSSAWSGVTGPPRPSLACRCDGSPGPRP